MPVKSKKDGGTPLLPSGEGYLLNAAGQRTVRIATAGPLKEGEDVSVEVQSPAAGAPEGTFNLSVRRGAAEPKVIPNVTLGTGKGQRNIADVLTKETDKFLTAEVLESAAALTDRAPAVGAKSTLSPMTTPAQPIVAPDVQCC